MTTPTKTASNTSLTQETRLLWSGDSAAISRSLQPEDALDPRLCGRRQAFLHALVRDAAADRRQRRVGVDRAGDILGVHPLGQREPVFGDELAGMRTDDRRAQ